MSALEKIKRIQEMVLKNPELDDDFECFVERSKAKLLLEAFSVMRGMAIQLRHEDGQFGWGVGEKDYENIIDKEFEKRMDKK